MRGGAFGADIKQGYKAVVGRQGKLAIRRRPGSGLLEGGAVYLIVGRGNVLANSSDLHVSRVWIQRIARPEFHALSLDPGYTFLLESKHALKVEKIRSYGGSVSVPLSNHQTVLASQIAASSTSWSVMLLRIHDTHRASLALIIRIVVRSFSIN